MPKEPRLLVKNEKKLFWTICKFFSKTRAWEKERRNRLAEAFGALCKTLPCYNPSIPTPKIDILRNAATHIEDLQSKIKELIASSNSTNSIEKAKGKW